MCAPPGRRVLNSQDRCVLLVDDLLKDLGHTGMQCQTQLWFEGAVDEGRLRPFSAPMDLEAESPLRLVLLRRPGSGDVLLIQFSHVLVGGKAPSLASCTTGPILSINDLEGLHLGLSYTNDYLSDDLADAFLEELACDLQS